MERLTGWDKGNAYYIECCARDIGDRPGAEQCDNGCAFCDENIKQCELLARYEDTGLTPEEIAKLQKKQRWIPVSEQPREEGTYICTLDGELAGQEEPFTGMCGFYNGKWDEEGCVIAWMPLSEPYKEV